MTNGAIAGFLDAMSAAGVRPAEPIALRLAEGGLIRFRCNDDKRPNAWAVLKLGACPAGAFGWYRGRIDERWRSDEIAPVSPRHREKLKQLSRDRARQREIEKRERQELAAGQAERLWRTAQPVGAGHPYLIRKSIAGEGLRQRGECLLVPLRDIDGRLWNLQRITPEGSKRFLSGARVSGLMCTVGSGGGTTCIGEGYATMAAVRAATGLRVIVAFSAGNLSAVATAVRQLSSSLDIVLCADDDAHLIDHPQIKKNVGLDCAKAAAVAVGGRLAIPSVGAY